MGTREHWDAVYGGKTPREVSWFCPHLETSLAFIDHAAAGSDAFIIDVGGGASTLIDDLLEHGYGNVTVLDISQSALEVAKKRLGHASRLAQWVCVGRDARVAAAEKLTTSGTIARSFTF